MKYSPLFILNVSQHPTLSLGCSSGIKAFGKEYCYIKDADALLRIDLFPKYNVHKKLNKSWEQFIEKL